MREEELRLINKNITSLLDVPLHPTVTSLNLHCNQIPRIEHLTLAWHLRHLDLSSNCISKIENISSLTSLRTLNLSCNTITKVEGLDGLFNLTRLNLCHNQINDLTGLLCLHGTKCKLKYLSLHSNHLDSIDHLLQCLHGLQGLKEVTTMDNPVCRSPGFRKTVMHSLPQTSILDGLDHMENPSYLGIDNLERYMDLLTSSDTSHNEYGVPSHLSFTTPRSEEFLTRFRRLVATEAAADPILQPERPELQQAHHAAAPPADPARDERIAKLEQQMSLLIQKTPSGEKSSLPTCSAVTVHRAKRETDRTSESECDSGKENSRQSRTAKHRNSTTGRDNKGKRSDSDQENHKQRVSKTATGLRKYSFSSVAAGSTRRVTLKSPKASSGAKSKSPEEEETYRAIVEERDQERERRWKAEQAARKLTEELKCLKMKVCEEKDLQNMALHTTDRLKDLLLKERSGRCELQTQVEELEGRCQSLSQQLGQARSSEEQHKAALSKMEESISHGEALRAHQHAEEMKRHQELENKAAALKRELDIQRASVCQHKDKVQQLHELLAAREQEHRKQLEKRLQPGGADFRKAVAEEVASLKQTQSRIEEELKERLAEGRKEYTDLENEFRMALSIEAARFFEVKEVCDQMTTELSALRATLAQSQQREKESGSLVQELTAMVKEQKSRISQLVKAKRDAVTELKRRLHSMEAEVEQDRHLSLQLEVLKKDKARLLSQLTAQESVIDGLRAERRIWGQELAQQGSSLAQDRGRLEARIEVLSTELETQKKQIERDTDALKIKSKIIEDQTETIRKLKESMQECNKQIRQLREEMAQTQKKAQQQLEEATTQLADQREHLEHLSLRKEELKQQLEEKEAELDEVKRVHSDSSRKWQQKADLLTRLESQVKCMKENFDAKERSLLQERDKATEAHKVAVEKLHSVDDAFRRQLESVQIAHQTELQKSIEQANQRVFEVEEEMRQLLTETETNKRIMEDKMRRLSSVLKDLSS